ncbi:MAG: homoserine kinase [Spirochaetaceae bacterium]|nr:MAG: homoserine kinase [Spirochaetaceae bacterium]
MADRDSVSVFAPATVANVASGFDVLGFALERPGDTVVLRKIPQKRVEILAVEGDNGQLPRDPDRNTASVAARRFLEAIGFPFGLEVTVRKQMPMSSGLGSSAASSVAAVYAANVLSGSPLTVRQLLPFTMQAEEVACGSAHADNVAPALLGGFVLIRSYEPLDVVQLPVPGGLAVATVHPHTEIKTEDARRILKKELRLSDAVRQWGNLAALVAALFQGDMDLLSRSLQDVVAEPRRGLLIPGFAKVKQTALHSGALGCSISGSGPSVFSLCVSMQKAKAVGRAMQSAFAEVGLDSDVYLSGINQSGPVILEE